MSGAEWGSPTVSFSDILIGKKKHLIKQDNT